MNTPICVYVCNFFLKSYNMVVLHFTRLKKILNLLVKLFIPNTIHKQYHKAKWFFLNSPCSLIMSWSWCICCIPSFILSNILKILKFLRVLYLYFWWSEFSFLIHPLISSFSWWFACSCALSSFTGSSAFEFHVSILFVEVCMFPQIGNWFPILCS